MTGPVVLVTGATSGIGREVALALATPGAGLGRGGRDSRRLNESARAVRERGADAVLVPCDLGVAGQAAYVVRETLARMGVPDLVVLAAGVGGFGAFDDLDEQELDTLFRVNVIAPMAITRALLPHLRRRGSGRIVFVGSIFGSIAFPWFAAYSSTKGALRTFAEALRRELHGSGIGITYVAPRGTRTPMTSSYAAAAVAAGMHLDEPAAVAQEIVAAARGGAPERYLGFPESIFVRVNAVFPRLIDRALRGTARVLAAFGRGESAAAPSRSPTPTVSHTTSGAPA